jgi:CheY-like chemotaxis protein
MRVLVLDDSKIRLSQFRQSLIGSVFTAVEHSKDCIYELATGERWDWFFCDHDLDGKVYVPSGPGTGYEVAEWLSKNPDMMPQNIIIHTSNEKAAPLMMELLPDAQWMPCIYLLKFNIFDLENGNIFNIYKMAVTAQSGSN